MNIQAALSGLCLSVLLAGCAAQQGDEPVASTGSALTATLGVFESGRSYEVTEGDDASIGVTIGGVRAPRYAVSRVDRSIGAPKITEMVSARGWVDQVFTWHTTSPLGSLAGYHVVEIASPLSTLSFVLNVSPKLSADAVRIGEFDDMAVVTVTKGTDAVLDLDTNDSRYAWTVTSVDRTLGRPRAQWQSLDSVAAEHPRQHLVWSTVAGPLDTLGDHTVALAYGRDSGGVRDVMRTFTVTLRIVSPE